MVFDEVEMLVMISFEGYKARITSVEKLYKSSEGNSMQKVHSAYSKGYHNLRLIGSGGYELDCLVESQCVGCQKKLEFFRVPEVKVPIIAPV